MPVLISDAMLDAFALRGTWAESAGAGAGKISRLTRSGELLFSFKAR